MSDQYVELWCIVSGGKVLSDTWGIGKIWGVEWAVVDDALSDDFEAYLDTVEVSVPPFDSGLAYFKVSNFSHFDGQTTFPEMGYDIVSHWEMDIEFDRWEEIVVDEVGPGDKVCLIPTDDGAGIPF